jgi:hypothetical protein|tara:strand:- start:1639 stop:1857 length:219 start_codon:yes stop_codon:yes gene_type:complete
MASYKLQASSFKQAVLENRPCRWPAVGSDTGFRMQDTGDVVVPNFSHHALNRLLIPDRHGFSSSTACLKLAA